MALPKASCAAVDEREVGVVADCEAQSLRLRKIDPPRIISVVRRATAGKPGPGRATRALPPAGVLDYVCMQAPRMRTVPDGHLGTGLWFSSAYATQAPRRATTTSTAMIHLTVRPDDHSGRLSGAPCARLATG
jgi:hypothetical protein